MSARETSQRRKSGMQFLYNRPTEETVQVKFPKIDGGVLENSDKLFGEWLEAFNMELFGKGRFNTPEYLEILAQGIPFQKSDSLREHYNFTIEEMSDVLGVASRTYRRFRDKQLLSETASQRFVRLGEIISLATDLWGGNDIAAAAWLKAKNDYFNGKTLLDVMSTEIGANAVVKYIKQLQAGISPV